jgi:hypothetical protein
MRSIAALAPLLPAAGRGPAGRAGARPGDPRREDQQRARESEQQSAQADRVDSALGADDEAGQ